jgi:predicted transcriptional regulator
MNNGKNVPEIVQGMITARKQDNNGYNKSRFAEEFGISPATVTCLLKGERGMGSEVLSALLRGAEPEEQRTLLEALVGIEDVEQFAADLLASAGVVLIETRTCEACGRTEFHKCAARVVREAVAMDLLRSEEHGESRQ